MNQEQTAPASKRYLALYFALTIPLAWLFWVPMGLVNRQIWPLPASWPTPIIVFVMSTLGAVSPLVALGIIERVSRGHVTLAAIFRNIRLHEWRRGWTLASPLVMIGVHVVLVLAYFCVGAVRGTDTGPVQIFKPDVFSTLGWWILLVIPLHFFPALITSPLFEEPGWRGFAFENLQHYVPRDLASLTVGSYWWLWHQGMNVAFGLEPSLYGYASMLLDSFAIDALYTLSRRNVLAAMLAHQAMGTVFMFLYAPPAIWYVLLVKLAAVAVLRYQATRRLSEP